MTDHHSPRNLPLSRIISHRIHGTGIFIYLHLLIKIMKKWTIHVTGVYTVDRPMGILWVLRLSSIEHDGVLYDNAMDLSAGLRWDNFQGIGRDVGPRSQRGPPMGNPFLLALYYVGIYGLYYYSLRIPIKHNKYHGYSVRGTPDSPLNLWCWNVKMLCSILVRFLLVEGVVLRAGWEWSISWYCHLPEVGITTTMNFVRNNTEFWTHVTYAAFCFQVSGVTHQTHHWWWVNQFGFIKPCTVGSWGEPSGLYNGISKIRRNTSWVVWVVNLYATKLVCQTNAGVVWTILVWWEFFSVFLPLWMTVPFKELPLPFC